MTDHTPRVSVVIATYNWSSVLRYAVESVLWQTMPDLEVLVVGDGCTDDSADVVASFGDDRVRWHNLPANTGSQSDPNNTGMALARGQWIAYLGHDDVWLPDHLDRLLAHQAATGAGIVNSLCVYIGPDGTRIRRLVGLADDSGAPRRGDPISTSTVLFERRLYEQVGGWKHHTAITAVPQFEFFDRLRAAAQWQVLSELTVIKFPSAWRRNSYVEQPSHEQAAYVGRIRTEPDFRQREWQAIALAYADGQTEYSLIESVPTVRPPGWQINQYRRIRGLEPVGPTRTTPRDYARYAFAQVYKRIPAWLRPRHQWRRLRTRLKS